MMPLLPLDARPMRTLLLLAVFLTALLLPRGAEAGSGAAGDQTSPDAFPGRFCLEHDQGYVFLGGGYVDGASYYSALWDTGRSFRVGLAYAPWPFLRAGLYAEQSSHPDRGRGLDQLDRGHVHLALGLDLPLALPWDRWASAAAARHVRGFVPFLAVGAGLSIVDPLWDAFGRIFDRTFTWSLGLRAGLEYRFPDWGVFLSAGVFLHGPLTTAEGGAVEADPMNTFPVALGLRVYL